MYLRKTRKLRTASLPDGSVISVADLPPADTRWVASRKAIVCQAIAADLITREDAISRWQLSDEELDGWLAAVKAHGTPGLKVTLIQKYRRESVVT